MCFLGFCLHQNLSVLRLNCSTYDLKRACGEEVTVGFGFEGDCGCKEPVGLGEWRLPEKCWSHGLPVKNIIYHPC